MNSRHGVGHVIRYGRFEKFSKRLSEKKKKEYIEREREKIVFFLEFVLPRRTRPYNVLLFYFIPKYIII